MKERSIERVKEAARMGLAAEWMSETESGPEAGPEREAWLKAIGKDKDQRGRPTKAYSKKGKGNIVYEVKPVKWRKPLVSSFDGA